VQARHEEPLTIRTVPVQVAHELINAGHHYLDVRRVLSLLYYKVLKSLLRGIPLLMTLLPAIQEESFGECERDCVFQIFWI
jgi:hypothetical protein